MVQCIVLSLIEFLFQVLLVTSSRAPERWIVPGGGLEPNEEPSVAAIREVVEEAGVRGHLGRCLGTFEVSKNFRLMSINNSIFQILFLIPCWPDRITQHPKANI